MKNAKLTVAIYEGWHYRRRWQNQEKHESKQHQRFDGKNQIHWKVLENSYFSAGYFFRKIIITCLYHNDKNCIKVRRSQNKIVEP